MGAAETCFKGGNEAGDSGRIGDVEGLPEGLMAGGIVNVDDGAAMPMAERPDEVAQSRSPVSI